MITAYIHQYDPAWEMGVSSKLDAQPFETALQAYDWLQHELNARWPDNYQWIRVGEHPLAMMPLSHQKLAWFVGWESAG